MDEMYEISRQISETSTDYCAVPSSRVIYLYVLKLYWEVWT